MEYIKKILSEIPKEQQSPAFLEYLSNYILEGANKEERKKKRILTDNRMYTINKRETSYEGLMEKFETTPDAVYDLFTDNKNQFLVPKISITPKDLAEVPGLADLVETIKKLEDEYKKAAGHRKYILRKEIIDLRRQQYMLKQSYYCPPQSNAQNRYPNTSSPDFHESYSINSNQEVEASGNLSLGNPDHISLLLCNYSDLKMDSYENFNSDMYYILQDLEQCADAALETEQPMYYEIMQLKIDGLSNAEIHEALAEKFGETFTPEYISCVWRKKIPKLIAEEAKRRYLIYHFTFVERGKWKRCSCCGQIKLAHPIFFSKNSASKDGFYSICKDCRSMKAKMKKEAETKCQK